MLFPPSIWQSHTLLYLIRPKQILCYNKDLQIVSPPIHLNREQVSIEQHEKNLGNFCQLTFTIEILSLMYVIFIKGVIY